MGTEKDFGSFIQDSLKRFAIDVMQDRAMPDFRDGLKPVQRRLLWASYKLGLHNNKSFTKSSRITGETMGKFHPHSDSYSVLVNMAQNSLKFNLIEGQGNWGNFNSPPAASRYTEAKLSKYADDILLNNNYLEVSKMIPNYLDTEVEPIILPSLLPTLLLIGCQGIAVGYKTEIPTYTLNSVIKVVRLGLKRKLLPKDLLKLEFDDIYNAKYVGTEEQLLEYYTTGKGSLPFNVEYELDKTNKRAFIIKSVVGNGENMITKLENDDEVYKVNDLTSGNNIKIQVILKTSVKQNNVKSVMERICSKLKTNRIFITNVIKSDVIETKDDDQVFYENTAYLKETNLTDLLNEWIEWRIQLETDMLNNQINKSKEKITKLEFYRSLIKNIDIIFKVLQSKTQDLHNLMKTKLNCSDEEADIVLNLPIRRLSKLNDSELDNEIKEIKSYVKECKTYLTDINNKISDDLKKLKI